LKAPTMSSVKVHLNSLVRGLGVRELERAGGVREELVAGSL
jgi:hypothetical protein